MDASEKAPLYFQLASQILDGIESGTYPVGSKIPSERELIESSGFSRITVRKAIDELESQGVVRRVQGIGTYVCEKKLIQDLGSMYSFSREMRRIGKVTTTHVILNEEASADHRVAKRLGLEDGSPVVLVRRLRCSEDESPIMVESTYFKLPEFSYVLDFDLERNSLYGLLEDGHGIVIDRAKESFQACELDDCEARLLGSTPGRCGLLVTRLSYSDERLVSYSTTVSAGDSLKFTITLIS